MDFGDSTRYKTFKKIYNLHNEVYDPVWSGLYDVDLLESIWGTIIIELQYGNR